MASISHILSLRKALTLLALFACSVPAVAESESVDWAESVAFSERNDDSLALVKDAEVGDTSIQVALGGRYASGVSCPQDFAKTAEEEDTVAQYFPAIVHAIGIEQNHSCVAPSYSYRNFAQVWAGMVTCKYCGRTASTAEMLRRLGPCPNSPSRKHVALRGRKTRSLYVCRYCGKTAPSVRLLTAGACPSNPNGKRHVPAN